MAQMNLQQQYEDIHARAMEAVAHWDAAPAWNIYRELEKFLEQLPAEQQRVPAFAQEIATLKRSLLMVGFPALPQEEAAQLFREHILDFFRVDVDFAERLKTRYVFAGYGDKEEERKRLYEAILQNTEHLGQFTIGEWIKLFEQRLKREARDRKSAALFLTQTGEAASLGKNEQVILGKILAVYDEYLCREVLDDFDMAFMGQSSQSQSSNPRNAGKAEHMPLLQALSKYEKLGNQLITEGRIKVRSQSEPVRPSLLHWLKYYRDELGVGHHDSVQRGDFLFRSENGRQLSAEERERVTLILKSVEENFPLTIDTGRQEIIFPAFQGVTLGTRQEPAAIPPNARIAQRPAFPGAAGGERAEKTFAPASLNPYENGGLRIGRGTHFSNLEPVAAAPEPGAVSFSTSHVFPAEKEVAENRAAVPNRELPPRAASAPQPAPQPPRTPSPQPNPFHIRPVSVGKPD